MIYFDYPDHMPLYKDLENVVFNQDINVQK